eukprot:1158773-Pelagomonas_calceolata.AAC.28
MARLGGSWAWPPTACNGAELERLFKCQGIFMVLAVEHTCPQEGYVLNLLHNQTARANQQKHKFRH